MFDTLPERRGTFSFKWEKYRDKDILPCWVADTEFRCAPPILDAISARVQHGNLGYTLPAQYAPANHAVVRWLQDKHAWTIQPEWLVWVPGVVPGFNMACKAYCQPGDKVIVQTPNYPPLLAAPSLNGLQRIDVASVIDGGRWTLDWQQLEQAMADPLAKLLVLCNPMNPVGSVLTQAELARIADLCQQHNVVLCSDEIHCDLILQPNLQHIPAGKVEGLTDRSVTLMAASKTFNVAGLGCAFAIIPDAHLRRQFVQAGAGIVPWVNILGLVATEAAFTQCDEWHQAQLHYLRENRDLLVARVNAIDGLSVVSPEATFLAWVDASGLGVSNVQQWAEARGIGPSPGSDFGAPQFFRVNFGCSRAMVEDIVHRLAGAGR